MKTFIFIDRRTGEEVDRQVFNSWGKAQAYAATLGKNVYAKRL